MRALGFTLLAVLLRIAAWGGELTIDVSAIDQGHQAVPAVKIQLKQGENVVSEMETGPNGRAEFKQLKPGQYEVSASRDGLVTVRKGDLILADRPISLELTMVPAVARAESVEVRGTISPVEQGGSTANEIAPQVAKDLPGRPSTVADALPLLPGVVRSPGGGLQISGSGEHRSALIVNSADVTDPATGQFGLTVPIDSVETLNVFQTPFLAEYGRFTAGLVSVETRRGGDKWKWEVNDPFPEFFIRSYKLRGLRDATPRLNFEGPLLPGKLYFSEGFEYEIRKTPVFTLPFPDNLKRQEGINSFSQLDWVVSARQLVTATVHVAPQRMDNVNMSFFNPGPTTPDASTRNYTATLADRFTIGGGLLENTLSTTRFDADMWSHGPRELTMTPVGNTGNYFAQQGRNSSRVGWLATYSFPSLKWLGTHNLKAGSYLAGSSEEGRVNESPIDILDSANQLIERISFTGGQPFRMTDMEFTFFGQDHWIISPRLAADLGLRAESQEVSETVRLAPRAGIAWNLSARTGTVVRAGLGLFYDRVPLNVYAFNHYPNQAVTMFNDGQVSAGPFVYQNDLGQVVSRSHFIFQEPVSGNFSPRSATWSAQVEQPLWSFLKLRAGYLQNYSDGLVILNRVAPDPLTNTGAYLLSGTGQSRYRQFELTARVRLKAERQLFFSYVRSRARGDLNDFAGFLGSFPSPIVRANQFSNLPADLPNRFLAWGVVPLPWGFRVAPMLEYRSGFPYVVTDAAQNYVGVPNLNRFPNFLSIDARVSKDFKVNPKYTVRLSVSSYNLTGHYNPEALHTNIADPAFGQYFGQRGRHSTVDFDVIF